jgi:exonuclease VII small subunit
MTAEESRVQAAEMFIQETKKTVNSLACGMALIELYEEGLEKLEDCDKELQRVQGNWAESVNIHQKNIEEEVKKRKALQKKHQLLRVKKGNLENRLYDAEKKLYDAEEKLNKAASKPISPSIREVEDNEQNLLLKLSQYIDARKKDGESPMDGWLATLQTVVSEAQLIREKRRS